MYIGRIVCVGQTNDGQLCAAYRVSSRSFPNRKAVTRGGIVSIIPKEGHENDIHQNPYIAYNCLRTVADEQVAVVTNGSQTDPIAEKINMGMPVRDSLTLSSLALDFEKDDYSTPRVSAVADLRDNSLWLAVIRHDGVEVRKMNLNPGQYAHVATYEEDTTPTAGRDGFTPTNAAEACTFLIGGGIFAEREKPITAVAAVASGNGFELATKDAPVA